jgi:hypothetical protein
LFVNFTFGLYEKPKLTVDSFSWELSQSFL